MKLLLTSGGVTNPSIRAALDDLLGRPVEDCDALCIPTAQYGHPFCTPVSARRFVAGGQWSMAALPWRSIGLLELTALPSMGDDRWVEWVRAADVLLVDGGDALYLAHWVRESGLEALLPALTDTVWVGVSAGSMVLTPRIGPGFGQWTPPDGTDRTLGLVDFAIFPHLEHPDMPDNTTESAQRWAAHLDCPAYAIDDDTALRVVDGAVDVVSEGRWLRLA